VKALPPPPPPRVEPVAPPPAVAAVAPPSAPKIFTGEERNLVLPQTLFQALPKYPGAVPPRGVTGVVEVVIDESGSVESAAMVVPVTNSYDKMVMSATNKWLYTPAMMNGKPVKFRKRIQITVTPPAP
jgi:TonB family protein